MNEHFEKVREWYSKEPFRVFIISGYAGCGKTTLARKIPEQLNIVNYKMLAPTGKAATVLGNAQTIHSYLYNAKKDERTGELHFYRKNPSQFYEMLLIVDEISMVNKELMQDLRSLNIPIIGLGDPAQLPPVNGTNDILSKPDIFLTKVYRNDGGLLELATDIRNGNKLKREYDSVQFRRNSIMRDFHLLSDDSIIICRYNKTRNELNAKIREEVKQFKEPIEVGDKLIVLNNSRTTGLMNGSIVQVLNVDYVNLDYNFAIIDIKNDIGVIQKVKVNLNVILGTPSKLRQSKYDDSILSVDYAYAITCHKSQGSEFKEVFIIVEGEHYDDFQQWYYTAVTRARSKLYIYKNY